MQRWRRYLKTFGPREEQGLFYPDSLEPRGPVLIQDTPLLAACFTASRVLHGIALRRGTLVKPSTLESLERLFARGLSEEALHHCEAEAESILGWIESPPPADLPLEERGPGNDLELMVTADLESRLSVARFALEEDYDLELEYFDPHHRLWTRTTAALLDIEGAQAADFETALLLEGPYSTFEVPLKYVRWLMPVPPTTLKEAPKQTGEVIPFQRPAKKDSEEKD